VFRWWTVALAVNAISVVSQPELIERTLAIVGGQPITLSDVRVATTFGLVESAAALPVATRRLVERALVLREVQRYAPPEPSLGSVDIRMLQLQQRFETRDRFLAALEGLGFSELALRAWVREDLRIAAYIDQRFTAASAPSDEEVAAAYARERARFDALGMSVEQASATLRERLTAARRSELTTDWIADLRRRTPVVELIKQ
jgi:hypothetical protein